MAFVVLTFTRVRKYFAELNLFENEASRSNPFHLRTAFISTRVYIALLTTAIAILIVFTALSSQSEVMIIRNPSLAAYEALVTKNTTSLSCPCRYTTVLYGNFTSTTIVYHPICASVFVSSEWITHLFSPDIGKLYQADFRVLASSYFQLLAAFCSQANSSVEDALDDFRSETFLTLNVLVPSSLGAQVQAKSQVLRLSTANNIRRLLQLVRTTTYANMLQTAIQTSRIMSITFSNRDNIFSLGDVSYYDEHAIECKCIAMRSCSLPSGFFDRGLTAISQMLFSDFFLITYVPGFVVGCSPVESLLQSSLECLFDESCLETIFTFIPTSNITGVHSLAKNETLFVPNTALETIIDQLFIENWTTEHSYAAYYAQCAPILCTYTSVHRNNILYIITKLLGLYGGLTTVLRLCIPLLVGWWRARQLVAATELPFIPHCKERFRAAWRSVRMKIIELNLFKTRTMRTDPHERTTLRISTWIYLILLCVSMSIIVLFNGLVVQTRSVTVESPSEDVFSYLQEKYSESLRCPCSEIAIPHHSFISLSPQFHPVCTSVFVSDLWMDQISNPGQYQSQYKAEDIFISGHKYFKNLAILCSLMKATASDASLLFNQSFLISDQSLSRLELMTRARQAFDQFTSDTVAELKSSLALIRSQTATMFTTGQTDHFWVNASGNHSEHSMYFQAVPKQFNNCSCGLSDECQVSMVLYNYTSYTTIITTVPLLHIPSMFAGCFSSQSLLQSSLECLFDSVCLGLITQQMDIVNENNYGANISKLETNSSRFPPKTSVDVMINDMMIESWGEQIIYKDYYQYCAPKECSYFYTSRNDALYIFTSTVGLFGGLSVALRIIVKVTVGWIRNRIRARAEPGKTIEMRDITGRLVLRDRRRRGVGERLRALHQSMKMKFLELNLFESEASWDNPRRQRHEIIATRVYLLVLVLAILILILYNSISIRLFTVTVKSPSVWTFDELVSNPSYSSSLECPCENISIPYGTFVHISLQPHQLCSSDFIVNKSKWMDLISSGSKSMDFPYDDYRFFIVGHFRLLSHLCALANETLTKALSVFLSDVHISKRVQSRAQVETQLRATVDEFRLSIVRRFVRPVEFNDEIGQGNGLLSRTSSNWYILPSQINHHATTTPRTYGTTNCSCGTSTLCTSPATIDGEVVAGLRVGCSPLFSLLHSTLECLYERKCLDRLKNLHGRSNVSIDALDVNVSSARVSVRSLVVALFVDDWQRRVTYEHYYDACAPSWCVYLSSARANALFIVTTIIGLYGGLSVCVKILLALLMKIKSHRIECQ